MLRFSCLVSGLLLSLSTTAYPAGLNVKLVSITSPVPPGGTVSLVIATEPRAYCSGHRQAHYGNEVRLTSLVAESDGRAQWSWSILSGSHPVGIRSVHVTCVQGNRNGSLATVFDVRF
jgi:hypothetical protein